MELLPILKEWGPAFIGWAVAAYLGKFILDRYQQDIDAKIKLALALEALTKLLQEKAGKPSV